MSGQERMETVECETVNEVKTLKKQLEAAQRELKAQQQRMECSRRAEEDESPPDWAKTAAGIECVDTTRIAELLWEDTEFERFEDEWDVIDPMNSLHVKFRCDGQPFPSLNGRPGFPLSTCLN